MKKITLLLPFAFIVTFWGACKKEDTTSQLGLPEKTQAGKQTIGFLSNETLWTNSGQYCDQSTGACRENIHAYYFPGNTAVLICADRNSKTLLNERKTEAFTLVVDATQKGTLTFQNGNLQDANIFIVEGKDKYAYYPALNEPDFSVTVSKFDTSNKIISGEFSGKLFKQNVSGTAGISAPDSLIIKEGRFDIKLIK
jgi:hypothetical protein